MYIFIYTIELIISTKINTNEKTKEYIYIYIMISNSRINDKNTNKKSTINSIIHTISCNYIQFYIITTDLIG